MLGEIGFEPFAARASCFLHEGFKLFVAICAGDIKMAGPQEALPKGWALINDKIRMGKVSPASLHVGCIHTKSTMHIEGLGDVSVMEYDVEC